ncbi:MAG: carbohydrate ABC transporter permease [Bacillota bacterium]|nr:carbohydrate ABC transporter permease [Bacillota bacterium]
MSVFTAKSSLKIQRSWGEKLADIIIYTVLILLLVAILLPFYNMLLISFAKYEDIVQTKLYLYPKSLDFSNYRRAFEAENFANSFGLSVFVTITGTALGLLMQSTAAYCLSRPHMPFRRFFFYLILFTMFFGAGLIPWYTVMLALGFKDSIWVMIIPQAVNAYNIILLRNYFRSIPGELIESAKIDGAGELRTMFQIVLPVSLPILATVALFIAVGRWNEWYSAMIFIQDPKKIPLQLFLRRMIVDATSDLGNDMKNAMRDANIKIHGRSLQMAAVTITTVPILLVYPFLQRYFTTGIMIGAVKA